MTVDRAAGALRAERVEVVDGDGRIRLVLGDIGNPQRPGEVFGVALVDAEGRQRVWLALDDSGAALAFDHTGNNVVELGVDDGTGEATVSGAYLYLSDIDGRPVLGWRVDDDGSVTVRVAPDD